MFSPEDWNKCPCCLLCDQLERQWGVGATCKLDKTGRLVDLKKLKEKPKWYPKTSSA